MNPLYQRLKELDRDTFEKLCFQILKARFPGINLRPVDGSGGDGGIDIFVGSICGNPYVWQCKSFPNGFRSPQKKQVKDSLQQVVTSHSPRKWTLCLSIQTPKAWDWLDSLKVEWAGRVHVEIWTASEIVTELCYQRSIRNAFFPGAIIDDLPLREAFTKTAGLTDYEVRAAAEERADQYLTRLQDRDPRFSFEMSLGKDRKPQPRKDPNCLMTIHEGSTAVDVFGRDQQALGLDPPRLHVTIGPTGYNKFQEFQRTGKATVLTEEDIIEMSSNIGFLPPAPMASHTLELKSSRHDSIPCRVIFGQPPNDVSYSLIEFEVLRAGTDEEEWRSRGSHPFVIHLGRAGKTGQVSFELAFEGARPAAAVKFYSGLLAALELGRMEVFDLRAERPLFKGVIQGSGEQAIRERLRLFEDAAFVEQEYGVELPIPQDFHPQDLTNLLELRELSRGAVGSNGTIDVPVFKRAVGENLFDEEVFSMLCMTPEAKVSVFGVEVPIGPVRIQVSEATLTNAKEFRKRFAKAQVGQAVNARISFQSSVMYKT